MNSTTQLQSKHVIAITVKHDEPTITMELNNKASQANFDDLLLDALYSAFSIISSSSKIEFYFALKNSFPSMEAIPHNIAVFTNTLEQVFGQGALLLEMRIIESLHRKVPSFKFFPQEKDLSFINYLESLRGFLFEELK
jgi:hypothetical protein